MAILISPSRGGSFRILAQERAGPDARLFRSASAPKKYSILRRACCGLGWPFLRSDRHYPDCRRKRSSAKNGCAAVFSPLPARSRRSRQQLSSSAASLDCACTGLFQVSRRLYGCRSLRAPKATFSETAADIRLQFFPNTLRRPPPAAQTPPAGPHEPLLRPRPESRNGYKKRAAEKYPSPFSWLRLVQGLQITCNRAGSRPTSSADNP